MWIINTTNIVNLTRRWLYVVTVIFWAIGVLVPVSMLSYWTFYKILIPVESIKVPLSIFEKGDFGELRPEAFGSATDLKLYKEQFAKQPELQYLVRLNIEVFCNRNRNDDIYPILAKVSVVRSLEKQFILNCDSRYIYHQNNWGIPYNLRFWVSPFLSNIDKNVDITVDYFHVSGQEVLDYMRNKAALVSLDHPLIVGQANTNLEFKIRWDGFRFYLVKYPITSFLVGVSIFWSIMTSVTSFAALLVIIMHLRTTDLSDYVGSENEGDDTGYSKDMSFEHIKGEPKEVATGVQVSMPEGIAIRREPVTVKTEPE